MEVFMMKTMTMIEMEFNKIKNICVMDITANPFRGWLYLLLHSMGSTHGYSYLSPSGLVNREQNDEEFPFRFALGKLQQTMIFRLRSGQHYSWSQKHFTLPADIIKNGKVLFNKH